MEIILTGLGLGLFLSLAVGPVLFSVIKQSINNGLKGGLSFAAGVSLSDISLVIASNFFTELFGSLKAYETQISIVGSIFLVSVGLYYLLFKKIRTDAQGIQVVQFRKRDYAKIFLQGYLMNTLNPTIILFWLNISISFVSYALNQRITIFTIALAFVLGADILKVVLAGKLRNRLTIKNIALLNRINGVILILFGVGLIVKLLFFPSGS